MLSWEWLQLMASLLVSLPHIGGHLVLSFPFLRALGILIPSVLQDMVRTTMSWTRAGLCRIALAWYLAAVAAVWAGDLLVPAVAFTSGIGLLVSLAALIVYPFVAKCLRWDFLMGGQAWSETEEIAR